MSLESVAKPLPFTIPPGGFTLSGGKLFDSSGNIYFSRYAESKDNASSISKKFEQFKQHSRTIMRERLHHDAKNGYDVQLPVDLREEVQALYSTSVDFLSASTQAIEPFLRDKSLRSTTGSYSKERITLGHKMSLAGQLSEATIAALFFRTMAGDVDDVFTYIPASHPADNLSTDNDGYNQGYDGTVILRSLEESNGDYTRAQIKTRRANVLDEEEPTDNTYHPEIAMLVFTEIARTNRQLYLPEQIIKEINGEQANTYTIEAALNGLKRTVKDHIATRTTLAQESAPALDYFA